MFSIENLSGLEVLSFEHNCLDAEILSLLLDFAERNPLIKKTLRKLVLKRNDLGGKTSKRLMDLLKKFEELEHVDVANNFLDEKEIQMMCNVIHYNPGLICVDVRGNPGETKRVGPVPLDVCPV